MHFKTTTGRTKAKAKYNKRVAEMGRKRKVPVANEEKENANNQHGNAAAAAANKELMLNTGPIYTIMSKVQLNETFHNKYIKELKQLYEKMNHDAFIFTFIKIIKTAMVADDTNEFAYTTLIFCAKFVSSFEGEETHPLLADICRWLLTTISNNPHIRFRLCQFVNMILNALGNEATLDDVICDSIMEYMVGRLVDISSSVRVQAILAMQRLQVPDNPDDPVLRSYQYHLCSDPAPRVRQAVITSMGRNYHTIPYILDRLWDIDEKVRRHTYVHMSSYPVRSYKVSQRLTLLEMGLNDRSESVRKVVTNVMLQQWIESYQKDLLSLLGALKLDSSETEINRFRKIGKQVLLEIFKKQNNADIVACLELEEEGEYYRCVPYESLTLEMAFYWQCLTEYLQSEMAEELDQVIPELSVFCAYVETFYQKRKPLMDKFEAMEFQFVLLSLIEILHTYDLGDEIGRGKLQDLMLFLLKNCILDEKVIEVLVKCSENLITDQNLRHQFFLDIIHDICGLNAKQQDLVHDRNLISELLAHSTDADLNLKLSSLKVKILDLEEQEMNFVQIKDYVRAQQIIEQKNLATEEFTNLLRPLLEIRSRDLGDSARPQFTKVVKNESILQSLQITYYMVVSKRITSLQHSTCRLYNDFIYRNMASNQIAIRDWALRCGTAFSMLYEPLAKDVFDELYAQFFKNHNIRIWETAITCIFELLDRYGVDSFAVPEEQNKAKKTGRQLYNTLEFIDEADDDTRQSTTLGQGVGVIYMMSHFLDTCDDMCIVRAIINGFCRLILHGYIDNRDIIEKLLLRYFNPVTDPEINQILGVFLENLIQQRKQNLLHPCLMITVNSVISAPYDSPLHDIRPETITRFIIDATRPDAAINSCENAHNKLALVFLNEMVNNSNNKDLCKLLAKELITLEVNVLQQEELKNEMKQLSDKLILNKFDPKTVKNVIDFKNMLDGVFNPPPKRTTDNFESDEEENETNSPSVNTQNVLTEETNQQVGGAAASAANNTGSIEPDATITNEETHNAGNRSPSNRPESDQTAAISPTILNTPTTFGSENVTNHRLLRKSLNLSRNNSVDSNSTANNDQAAKPTKIRIEARIDSDKKSKAANENAQQQNSKSRRSLRYNTRLRNQSEGEAEFFRATPREPEIIEKILISPVKPAANSANLQNKEGQTSDENQNKDQQPDKNNQRTENSDNSNEVAVTAEEDHDRSEVIPESPIQPESPKTLILTGRSLRATRSRIVRTALKPNARKALSSSPPAAILSTPLRNGRKRVLQISPKLAASSAVTSPTRKQSCIEKDFIRTPPHAVRSHSLRAEKTLTRSKTSAASTSSLSKQTASTGLTVSKNVTSENRNATDRASASNSDQEKDVLKSIAPSNNTPSAAIADRSLRKKTAANESPHQSSVIATRNTVRKERFARTIMTRKRLSQENLTSESIYMISPVAKLSGRSRIPVRSAQTIENSNENTAEKKSSAKNPRYGTTKIPSVRQLSLKKKAIASSSVTNSLQSAAPMSGRFTRRRNV